MFYNGANEDALWQVGWVRLDDTLSRPLERCHGPLIEAPKSPGPSGHRVAFAASVIVAEDALYFTHNDRSVKRARLRRSRPRGII